MARAENTELIDNFEQFYRRYYSDEIGQLAQNYPNEQRSLYIDWTDLYRYDSDLADDYLSQPEQLQEYAEEALRLYDLPVDVSLGQAHVRVQNLGETTDIREIRARHVNMLVSVQGIVRKATDVRPKIQEAAFECQRCGTLTYIPQSGGDFQEPHECQGCERQGPFQINFDQSEFVDSQKLRVQESPEGLRGGETPQSIDVHIEDDITGEVTPGDHVRVTGVLHLEQQGSGQDKSAVFDVYMDGISVTIEDEQFEDMDITDEDKKEIVELSQDENIYEQMVGSMAPAIYGYDEEKLAMILQLFSGVTKHLPDESRIRGDLHMLLIGDPGTGKCVRGDTKVTLADGTEKPIREIVEANLDDPKPVDDGVYQEVDIPLPSMRGDGTLVEKRATKVWKRETPDEMYRIRTASGSELEVTPSHPLFVQSNGEFDAVRAEKIGKGDSIATPRILPTEGDDSLDVEYRESQSYNAVTLDLPDEWTPKLARLLGYIIAEGYVESRPNETGYVTVTNNDREILDDVAEALAGLGLNYTERSSRSGKAAKEISCSAGEFISFLKNLDPAIAEGSAEQRVPDALMRASSETKAEFLRAYVDSEGHVSAKQREISVASMSEELLEQVRSLLLSVGITSQLAERQNGSYRLRISGKQFQRYVERIGFVTDRKSTSAAEVDDGNLNTNQDVIPALSDDLYPIRDSLGLPQSNCGLPRSTYQHYERGDRNPSRDSLRTVVTTFEDRLKILRELRQKVENGDWEAVERARQELNVSQQKLADGIGVCQRSVSLYEQGEVIPDGGRVADAKDVVLDQIDDALDVADDVQALRSLVDSDITWDRIESIETVEPDYDWVYDLEVAGTHNYLTNNVVSHNSQMISYVENIAPRSVYTSGKGSSSAGLTAAAVRDDFGDGQQWTLEAGALVLADQGIAAVDELDKMAPDDRSAMHEGLEQQKISVSKAGINATLKSRCSLLGAANPKYGRFDQYEPIGEQIDLEPALISRFDLIFTVTDQPDEEHDKRLAEHILQTNYAGQLNTQRTEMSAPNISEEEVNNQTEEVAPAIDPDLLRKYIAYAKRNCYPTMTDEAMDTIRDFYVDLRTKGADEDAPVPVTARKLEALVRLSEASARVRLSDEVEVQDAERAVEITRSCLQDIGVDPETGQFDADVVETGTSKSQRDRIKNLKQLIAEIEEDYEEGAPVDEVMARADEIGMEQSKAEHEIDKLKQKGEVYEPSTDHLRTT
ncbi:LAGLIDADG family homing endonuclease [Halorussus lipolyticus]|uniref:LAGLIDADG family homing endonuclease n=1 Tax=Halorussus lipolyticus TaxID=3034024 RepID=UPI0023E82BAE|nr:LAGLIDADG family homing endonuclease [Halorussus sp. DT80]